MAAQLRASSYVRYGLPVRQPADEAHVRTCVCLVGRGEAGMSAVCRLRVWACAEYVLPHRWRAALHDPCSGCNATVCLSVFPSAALPVVPRCLLRLNLTSLSALYQRQSAATRQPATLLLRSVALPLCCSVAWSPADADQNEMPKMK